MNAPEPLLQRLALYLGIKLRNLHAAVGRHRRLRLELLRGLINLRGQIVTAIDLRRRLGLPERAADQEPMNVVMRTDDGAVSLLVDEIGDVIEVNEDAFEPPPDTLQGDARALIKGVYKLNGQLLLILDSVKTASSELTLALAS
jgi:purine-binding chemotaxis protein CheW